VIHSFGSLNSDFFISIGNLSEITGQRPSSFFQWNDEDDWIGRLLFDIEIIGNYKKKEMESVKRGDNS
jgi:hypothetical protein